MFGVDEAPATANNQQHIDFVRICDKYADTWKSKNNTSIEMLFLQLLSYYTKKFDATQFIVSIQTRMPVLKNEKQKSNLKLFCAGNIRN